MPSTTSRHHPTVEDLGTFLSIAREILHYASSQNDVSSSNTALQDDRGRELLDRTPELSQSLKSLLPNLQRFDPSSPSTDAMAIGHAKSSHPDTDDGEKVEKMEKEGGQRSKEEVRLVKVAKKCAVVAEDLLLRLGWGERKSGNVGWKWSKEDVEALRRKLREIQEEPEGARIEDETRG